MMEKKDMSTGVISMEKKVAGTINGPTIKYKMWITTENKERLVIFVPFVVIWEEEM